MSRGSHQRLHRRTALVTVSLLIGLLAVVVTGVQLVGPTAAKATGGGSGGSGGSQTVRVVINIPALPLTNLCNADVVNLSGDMYITTTTTPHSNGGYTVRSSAVAPNLRGQRIAPLPMIGYRGEDAENAYSYYAPPPQPSTHRVVHWTKLVPQGRAPTMYLVVVIREVILADGTPAAPVAERAFLVCKPPRSHKV